MKQLPKINLSSLESELTIHGLHFYGFADLLPNPDPILKAMGWNKDVEAYRELLSDPQLYGAIENNRKPGTKALMRYLDNEKTPKQEMDFFSQYFDKLVRDGIYDNLVSHTLDTPQFGRMVFGLVWQMVDGYYLPVKIEPMPHSLCKFNMYGDLMVKTDSGSFAPPEHPARYIVLRHKPTLDNPYGEALLSKCYWNIKFKKEGRKMWAVYTEKFGMPWVAAEYNPAQLANQYQTDVESATQMMMDALQAMVRDGIIIFPDGAKVNMMNGGNINAVQIFERLVRICDEQNTKLQLGHSGATESTSGDKLSNDTTATDVRQHIIDADKIFPIQFFNKLIEWIHYFNFSGNEKPYFNLYAQEDVDMQYAERDAKIVPVLAQSGMKFTKEYMIKTYGFAEEDIDIAENINNTPSLPASPQNRALFLAEAKPKFKDQDLIDDTVDDAVENSESSEMLLATIIEKINSMKEYEEVKDEIEKLMEDLNSDNLEEKLTQILFVSDIVGRLSVQSETEG